MQKKTLETARGTIVHFASECPNAERPWLVFLPGLTADHRLFEKQIEHFESRANCIVWDPPAHGLSRPFELGFTMDDMARWIHDILAAEGASRPVLIGQSMGGYVSQAFIDLFPGEASGFVSIDSAPLQRRYYPGWEVWLLKHTEWMYRCIPWSLLKVWGPTGAAQTEYGRKIMLAFMTDYEQPEYAALAGAGFKLLADAIEAGRKHEAEAGCKHEAEAGRAYEIDCPALLICGTKDQAGDVKPFNRKWTKGSGIPLHWIEGAGHNANCDAPEEVNRLIEGLITEIERREES